VIALIGRNQSTAADPEAQNRGFGFTMGIKISVINKLWARSVQGFLQALRHLVPSLTARGSW